jgi:hypothetical protein
MSRDQDGFDALDELIMQAQASIIAKLDAATDWDAVLTDVYVKAAKDGTPEAAAARYEHRHLDEARATALGDVTDRIAMLVTLLGAVSKPGENGSPLIGSIYLGSASRSLDRLGSGLAKQRLGKNEALRLVGNAEHNLREADAALRAELGRSLDHVLRGRIDDLVELGGDVIGQVRALSVQVKRLFDTATEPAVPSTVPQA